MPRTYRQALKFITGLIRKRFKFESGRCKQMCREAYNIPTDGSIDAADAFGRTRHRFHGLWIPGAFIWWRGGTPDPRTGKRHGHVAIMGWRKGRIRSVDYPRVGEWNNTTVKELEAAWPLIEFAGTSLDIDGVPVRRIPLVVRRWTH